MPVGDEMQVVIDVVEVGVGVVVGGGSPSAHCEGTSMNGSMIYLCVELSHYLQVRVARVGASEVQVIQKCTET